MGWLTNIFRDTQDIDMLKGLVGEYKIIVQELRDRNNTLEAQREDLIKKMIHNSYDKENESIKKPLSEKELKIYNIYIDQEPNNNNEWSNMCNIPSEMLRLYKSKIKNKGWDVSFVFK